MHSARPRFDLRVPVNYRTPRKTGHGTIWDVSTSGARVEGASLLPRTGTRVRLRFSYASNEAPLLASAEVVRRTESGFAVRFLGLGENMTSRLDARLPHGVKVPSGG